MGKKAIIVGSTGLIGSELEKLLLENGYYSEVLSITRRQDNNTDSKYKNLVVDFENLEKYSNEISGDHVFCCLGTTMKKAGSKEKFRKVDFEYPLKLAKIARSNGADGFFLISSMGADVNSGIFYNQVKGEVEREIGKLDYKRYHIFRPSLLLGDRNEKRTGEKIAQTFFKALSFLFVGPLKKYKGIEFQKVARALVKKAIEGLPGTHIHESDELQNY